MVVCGAKGGSIRVQHVVDLGSRALVQRGWALADLRKIDGMMEQASRGRSFGLWFATSAKMGVWRCDNGKERAVFLWALLQCCVANLRRAPPVENLLLLDLQRVAEGDDGADEEAFVGRKRFIERRGEGGGSLGGGMKGRAMRDMGKGSKVTRTLSEPKASKVVEDFEEKRADTITPVATGTALKGLNMDERAFLAAAKRMGGGGANEGDEPNSNDPKARLFQNRFQMGDPKFVAERKRQQEKKLYRLSKVEQQDLALALQMFKEEKGTECRLGMLGNWTEAKIQELEAENIADIVNVEKSGIGTDGKEGDQNWPYRGLVESMSLAEPWLRKCQMLLSPYAELASELNQGVELLETQMNNISNLEKVLRNLLDTLSFELEEQSLVDGIGTADLSSRLDEFESDDFQRAVRIIASKVEALDKVSTLSDMLAVKNAQRLLEQRQIEASVVLLPALKAYVNQMYTGQSGDPCYEFFQKLWAGEIIPEDSDERQKFLVAVKSIGVFGKQAFSDLIDHYVCRSSEWMLRMLRSMLNRVKKEEDLSFLVLRTEFLAQFLFYLCMAEGAKAFQFFFHATECVSNPADLSFSRILRRQVPDQSIVSDFFTDGCNDEEIKACVFLHAYYYFDFFPEKLANCNEQAIDILLNITEKKFKGIQRIQKEKPTTISGNGVIYNGGLVSIEDNKDIRALFQNSGSLEPTRGNTTKISPTSKLRRCAGASGWIQEVVSKFFDVCRDISVSCHSMTEAMVGDVIGSFGKVKDVTCREGRREFFLCVQRAINMCCRLSWPELHRFQDGNSGHETLESVKTLCENLVATTMRSTEQVTQGKDEATSDCVKMQSYGYVSVKLNEMGGMDMFVPLTHLSTRVRKHVLTQWLEREFLNGMMSRLKMDGTKKSVDSQRAFSEEVDRLKAVNVVVEIDKIVEIGLEEARKTKVMVAIYGDVIGVMKERMEDAMQLAKRDKAPNAARAKLLSFSKDVMGQMKKKLGILQNAGAQ